MILHDSRPAIVAGVTVTKPSFGPDEHLYVVAVHGNRFAAVDPGDHLDVWDIDGEGWVEVER